MQLLKSSLFYRQINNLPEEYKNPEVVNAIQDKVKLSIGKTAPEIIWEENGTTKKLSELTIAKNYILAFWSTSCSHCLVEIPKLYEFTKDKPNIHVIAIALEKEIKPPRPLTHDLFKSFADRFNIGDMQRHIDTVGGIMLAKLGRLPRCGDAITIGNLTLTVETMRSRRITSILLQRDNESPHQEVETS